MGQRFELPGRADDFDVKKDKQKDLVAGLSWKAVWFSD